MADLESTFIALDLEGIRADSVKKPRDMVDGIYLGEKQSRFRFM